MLRVLNVEALLRMDGELTSGYIKKRGTLLTALVVLVYLATISEPTPKDVSILLIISLQKLPVFKSEILSECFKILLEESQI